jgi:hypothetical protein
MFKKLSALFLALSLVFTSSCSVKEYAGEAYNKHVKSKLKPQGPAQIRIVDLDGKARPVKRYVPAGNAQILQQQSAGNTVTEAALQSHTKPVAENISTFDAANNFNQTATQQVQAPPKSPIATPDAVKQIQNPTAQQMPATVSYDLGLEAQNSAKAAEPIKIAQNQQVKSKELVTKLPTKTLNNKKAGKKFTLKSPKTSATSIASQKTTSGTFIQIGYFGVKANANRTLDKNRKISEGLIEEVKMNGKMGYRVLLGPINGRAAAKNILNKAKKAGYKDAFIVK